jgi:hypothetical protein
MTNAINDDRITDDGAKLVVPLRGAAKRRCCLIADGRRSFDPTIRARAEQGFRCVRNFGTSLAADAVASLIAGVSREPPAASAVGPM